jgi:hypothetical protein
MAWGVTHAFRIIRPIPQSVDRRFFDYLISNFAATIMPTQFTR